MRRPVPAFPTFSAGFFLLVILCFSGFLRFYKLGHSPPGMHVDEASNIWNSWCLLKTGRDAAGERWPVFYFHSFGENRSTLMLYALMPFEAARGLSVVAARAAGAAAGVAAVFCIFVVGRCLFGEKTGLFAALFLAVSPWHVQQSRWAHEATLVPLLVLLPLALLLASNLVRLGGSQPGDSSKRGETTGGMTEDSSKGKTEPEPRPALALLAGLLGGACCYGYPAVRVFLPLFLLSILVITASDLARFAHRGLRRRALLLFFLGALLMFGPLVFKHLTDPAIGKRGATTWVWESGDGFATKAAKVLARYPAHFGPEFLFERGDPRIDLSPPPGHGLLFWWMLPLVVIGLLGTLLRMRKSPAARVTLVWLIVYPAADLLNRYEGMSVLRSLPGLGVFALLSAVGATTIFRVIADRNRSAAHLAAASLFLFAAGSLSRFSFVYFGPYDRQWDKYFAFQKDLLAAGEWLRPRFGSADAVVVTGVEMTHPYIDTLVSLEYDPARWLADTKTIVPGPLLDGSYAHEDVVTRYGKVWFLFAGLPLPSVLTDPAMSGRRMIFIVRPGELGLEKQKNPDFEVRSPRDEPVLWCFDVGG